MKLKDLETPALIIEETVMEENMDRMMDMLDGTRIQLRPHYKTHKSTDIAWMQVEKGAKGITCSKLSEAEDLVKAGIYDILIANQVVQPSKIMRLASLAGIWVLMGIYVLCGQRKRKKELCVEFLGISCASCMVCLP